MTMLRLSVIVIGLIGIVFSTASAQTLSPGAGLRQPSADEFLGAVPTITARAVSLDYQSAADVASIVSNELIYRYLNRDQAGDLKLLQTAFERLQGLAGPREVDLKAWNRAILRSWFQTNPVDLDASTLVEFDDYHIRVTPEDFNADGKHEWILEIRTGDITYAQTNYLVAQRASVKPGDYLIITTPLPWFDRGFGMSEDQSGTSATFALEDINGDGRPEWLLTVGRILSTGGWHENYGWLEILTWRDGKLVSLAPSSSVADQTMSYGGPSGGGAPIIPHRVQIELVRYPNRKTVQILIRKQILDNWNCLWTRTRTFGWNGSAYRLTASKIEVPNTPECAWRDAERAMAQNNFKQAIAYYEAGLKLVPAGPANQYERARLAIAYSLIGQPKRASAIITALDSETPASSLMAELIAALSTAYASNPTPRAICTAAYEVFQKHQQRCSVDSNLWSTACIEWSWPYPGLVGGTFDDVEYWADAWLRLPLPNAAGCDLSRFEPQPTATRIVTGPIWTPVPTPQQPDPALVVRNAQAALFSGQAATALRILKYAAKDSVAVHYLQALALEFTNQLDAARSAYLDIYLSNPDGAWKTLAALHLDKKLLIQS